MRTLRITAFTAILVALLLPMSANAQSNIMYGSSRNPLMNSANPAFFPNNSRVYLSLPGVNMNLSSPLAYSSIFYYDTTQDRTIINLNSVLDTLSSDKFRFGTNINAVGFGIDFNKFFLTLSTQAKVDFRFGMPSGVVTFLNEGNYNHTGDDMIELLDGELISVTAYAEGAIGFGYHINDNLTVGARAKLLIGYLDLSNAGSSLTIRTEPDYSAMTATLDLNMNYTSCVDLGGTDSNGNKVSPAVRTFMPKNYGLNFDLGVRYNTDLFEVSASILDLGPGIHWQDGVQRVVSARDKNSFTFTGVDVSEVMTGGTMDSTFARMLIDSLKSVAEYKTIDGGADYWSSIPTKVNVGGMFHITSGVSAGLLFHGEFERGIVKVGDVFKTKNVGFYSRTSAVARVNLYDWFEVVASASVITSNGNWNWFNPGVGVTLTPLRAFQVYAFLDYISNIYIVDAKQLNISAGLNLFFGSGSSR